MHLGRVISSIIVDDTLLMIPIRFVLYWGPDFPIPTEFSLLLVASVLGGGVALSLNKKKQDKE